MKVARTDGLRHNDPMSAHKHSTILAVYAHPDDEAFTTGGVLAHYAAQGHRVALICATRGEVGEISDPALATAETLGQVREEELRCAANALGLSELIFLGYRDSGMAGTAENQHPEAFANAAAEEVVARLVGHIRRLQPDVVITFDPGGGYGHPDHIAAHRHTVAAFHAAADAAIRRRWRRGHEPGKRNDSTTTCYPVRCWSVSETPSTQSGQRPASSRRRRWRRWPGRMRPST
jgi:LmbE family N-acetylglucosaminyl deacetylase